VEASEEETAVAVSEGAVGTPVRVMDVKSRGFEGEVTTANVDTPYLSLVGKSGALSDEFDSGSFVFDKQLELCSKKDSFFLTLVKVKLFYQEDIPFGEEGTPEKFENLNEAINKGWHNDWDDKDNGKYVIPIVNAAVLLEVDEEISEFSHDGRHYALAMWSLKGTGYTNVGKKIINACRKGWLRDAVHLGTWEISSTYVKDSKFPYYKPNAVRGEKHTPEFLQFMEDEVLMD